jgi:ADP-ribose pyrophosphatase YjhB (NUDIX family)
VPAVGLVQQLARELREECGLEEPVDGAIPCAFYRDDVARSFNIVLRVRLARAVEELRAAPRDRHWDCDRTRWLAVDEVAAAERSEGDRVIRATRALWRALGWSGGGPSGPR